jgi:hypothetical protein
MGKKDNNTSMWDLEYQLNNVKETMIKESIDWIRKELANYIYKENGRTILAVYEFERDYREPMERI